MEWLNTIIQGILLGGIYALFAIGLSLSFGIMRLDREQRIDAAKQDALDDRVEPFHRGHP